MKDKIITWQVRGTGGSLYRGIPSCDVAIAMAIDWERYDWSGFKDDEMLRVEVTAEHDVDEGGSYIVVAGKGSRGLGVSPEVRCGECRLVPRSNFSGPY